MDKISKNNIIIFIIIVLILIGLYKLFWSESESEEHLSSTSNAVLSNEAVQNMGSVLNSGKGVVNNLEILNSLKIGNLTIDSTGKLTWPNGCTMDSTGRIVYPGNKWTIGLEGDLVVLRYNGPTGTDFRYAFKNDGFWTFGADSLTTGNLTTTKSLIASGNINANADLLLQGNMYTAKTSNMNFNGPVLLGSQNDENSWFINTNANAKALYIVPKDPTVTGNWNYDQGLKLGRTSSTNVKDGLRAAGGGDIGPGLGDGTAVSNNADCINVCAAIPGATRALYHKFGARCFCKNTLNTTEGNNAGQYVTSLL